MGSPDRIVRSATVGALVGIATLLAGCAAGWRFGGALTADTRGRVGVEARAGMAFGLKTGDRSGVEETIELGTGPAINPGGYGLAPTVGLDFPHETHEGGIAWRLGLRGRFHFVFDDQRVVPRMGPGLCFALLPVRDEDGERYRHIGVELSAYFIERMDGDETESPLGLFSAGVVWETQILSDFDDIFPGKD